MTFKAHRKMLYIQTKPTSSFLNKNFKSIHTLDYMSYGCPKRRGRTEVCHHVAATDVGNVV